jgi:hypothetical protein
MNFLKKNKRLLICIGLLIVLAIPALLPLFHKGFFVTDDGEWMIIRFSAFHQALRDGQFPVRFLSRLNHGYGYPVANFLYPGFMYLAEPFKFAGLGFVNSIKVVIGLSLLLSSIFTFFWLRRLFDTVSAFVGGVVYLYVPYHLYDIYTRGSVGEILALAVVPFVLWQIERESFFWASLGIAVLILSHNTLAVFFLPIIILYMVISIKIKNHKKLVSMYSGIPVVGLALSAFFWLPAITELQYTRFSSVVVSDYFHYFASMQLIGIGSVFVFGLSLFLISKKHSNKKLSRLLFLFTALSICCIFYSSEFSKSIWPYLPSSFVQFPFRLLSYLIVCVSFVAAFALSYYKGTARWLIGGLIFFLVGFSSVSYLQPKEYFDKGEAFYATNEDTTTVKNEYMPKWVKTDPTEHPQQIITSLNPAYKINVEVSNANFIRFSTLNNNKGYTALVSKIYYPGLKADSNFFNEKLLPVTYNHQGLVEIHVPAHAPFVVLSFGETPLRLFADIVSFVTFACLVTYQLYKSKIWNP